MLKDWKACVREVGRSLSRYDGYSTYAKLETILSIPTSSLFEDNPSCYAAELISQVEKQGVSRRVAQDHLRHGVALGFLERIISGGGVFKPESGLVKKFDETTRVALSPLGRALCAANKLGLENFRNFLITCALLEHDFDMYGLLLKCAWENSENKIHLNEFSKQLKALLRQRKEWFDQNLLIRPVREQVCNYVPWANCQTSSRQMSSRQMSSRQMSSRSIGHHLSMRQQWAKHLLHIDENGSLTDIGRDRARLVVAVESKNSMFWLAPTPECAKKVGVLSEKSDSIFSAWDLFRPNAPESDPGENMIKRVAGFMETAFKSLRLRIFAQAPLAAVIPYVHFEETCLNKRINVHSIFDAVIRQNRDTFYCLLTAVPEECHYQLRTRSSARGGE